MQDRSDDLLPCPFCGGVAELRGHQAPEYWVGCAKIGCKATTEGFGDSARAIIAWNTRAGPMTVINADEWEPCSPAYLANGGNCKAPRVWNADSKNHWHPKIRAAPPVEQHRASTPTVGRDAIARALYFRRFPCEFPENEDFTWDCAQTYAAIEVARGYADAEAILALHAPAMGEVEAENVRLAALARANNDLARREATGRRALQASNAAMAEALELVIGSLRFDRDDDLNREVMRRVTTALATPSPEQVSHD